MLKAFERSHRLGIGPWDWGLKRACAGLGLIGRSRWLSGAAHDSAASLDTQSKRSLEGHDLAFTADRRNRLGQVL